MVAGRAGFRRKGSPTVSPQRGTPWEVGRHSPSAMRSEFSGRKSVIQGSAVAKAAERRRNLSLIKAEREAELQSQVGEWFEQFDEDGNRQLDRSELRKLLAHLHPDSPPAEEALDYLITKATQIVSPSLTIEGTSDGMIPWDAAVKTVTRYSSYLKHKRSLDALMQRFDTDNSGKLETSELAALLRAPRLSVPRYALEPPSPDTPRRAPLRPAPAPPRPLRSCPKPGAAAPGRLRTW